MIVVRKIKRKFRLYKQFESDIWGNFFVKWRNTKIGRFILMLFQEKKKIVRWKFRRFTYRIDTQKPIRKRKRKQWRFLQMKRLKLFYLFVSHRYFRIMDKKARGKQGNSLGHFIIFLEGRAAVISYRLFFVENIFYVKRFLFLQNLMVNKKVIIYPNFHIKLFDIIQVTSISLEQKIRLDVLEKIKNGQIYTMVPRYIAMNYGLMFGYMYRFPKKLDLAFPKNCLDIYRGRGSRNLLLSEPTIGIDIYRGYDHLRYS